MASDRRNAAHVIVKWDRPRPGVYTIPYLSIDAVRTALIIIDLQTGYVDSKSGIGPRLKASKDVYEYYYQRLNETVLPNVQALQGFCRTYGLNVIYCRLGVGTAANVEFADWSWQAAAQAPPGAGLTRYSRGAWERELWSGLSPLPDELIIDKATLSPFNSTPIDQILRNMGVENLLIAGVLTDAGVETTARSAGDRGFNAIVVEDACAAFAAEDHDAALATESWFVVKSTAGVARELEGVLG